MVSSLHTHMDSVSLYAGESRVIAFELLEKLDTTETLSAVGAFSACPTGGLVLTGGTVVNTVATGGTTLSAKLKVRISSSSPGTYNVYGTATTSAGNTVAGCGELIVMSCCP